MRKLVIVAICAALAASLMGCGKQPAEQVVDLTQPEITPATTQQPQEQGVDGQVTVLFPSDATEDTAHYKLSYSAPEFGNPHMDEAVDRYIDELYTRVTEERMPLADRAEGEALPATVVEYTLQEVQLSQGVYTNIIFTETATYGGDSPKEESIYTIVADPEGWECSLAAVSGSYMPEELVAQQVYNIIDREPEGYFGDVSIESISPALDLYNGFAVAEEGYTVFIPAGALAAEEKGILEFSFARSALYPEFVGDAVSAAEYEQILPQLNAAAGACGPGFASFAQAPTGAAAMTFTRDYLLNGRSTAQVSADEFIGAYQGIFGQTIAIENAPGVTIEGDTVTLSAQNLLYRFHCEDAYRLEGEEGETLSITGGVVCSTPGSGDYTHTASATATMQLSHGWTITSFEIN